MDELSRLKQGWPASAKKNLVPNSGKGKSHSVTKSPQENGSSPDLFAESKLPRSTSTNISRRGKIIDRAEQQLREVFNAFDRNQGGSIGKGELETMLAVLEGSVHEEKADELLKKFCLVTPDELSFHEFLTMLSTYFRGNENVEANAEDVFNMLDQHGSGEIDKEDIEAIGSHLGEEFSEFEIEAMMMEAGASLDGVITEEQFYRLLYDLREIVDDTFLPLLEQFEGKSPSK